MGLDGVEIFTNSSGSHHELRKLHRRVEVMKEATEKVGSAFAVTPLYTHGNSLCSPAASICMPINKDAMAIGYTMMAAQ